MRKTLITITALAVLLFSCLFMPASESKADVLKVEGAEFYTVVKGDTLWHIAGRFMEDPFKWPSVWKWNPYIRNPHLIYPGDVIKVTKDGMELVKRKGAPPVVKLSEEPVVVLEEVKPPAPLVKTYSENDLSRWGMISKKDLDSSGTIVAAENDTVLIHEGLEIYISFKDKDEVSVGDKFSIFTKGEAVRHPDGGAILGFMIKRVGSVAVTDISDSAGAVTAKVLGSISEIYNGAVLLPYEELPKEIAITESAEGIDGVIVRSFTGDVNSGERDAIFIDKGSEDGLITGNILQIYRGRGVVTDPLKESSRLTLPVENIGVLILTDVKKNLSFGRILKSDKEITTGDLVRTMGPLK